MTENEKRVRFALDQRVRICLFDKEVAALASVVDAAERRGEERVLRWLSHEVAVPAWALTRYRKARRARVGRRK